MDNKQIIEEIFRIAKITQPIPEPDEDGIYDFEGIIIVPTTIAKKSVGGIKYNRNRYEIISQTPTWSYDSGPDVIEKSIGEANNFSSAVISAVLEGMRLQMEDRFCSMFDDEQMNEIEENYKKNYGEINKDSEAFFNNLNRVAGIKNYTLEIQE